MILIMWNSQGGGVQQKDTHDINEIFFHDFNQTDAVRGVGTLPPSVYSPASINNGYADFSSGGKLTIDKDNCIFGENGNIGTIIVNFKPLFNGGCPSLTGFGYITDSAIGTNGNRILMYYVNQVLTFYIGDSSNNSYSLNATVPNLDSSKEYIFFFVLNCNGGARQSEIWFKEVGGGIASKLASKDTSAIIRSDTFSGSYELNNTLSSTTSINNYVMYNRVLTQSEIENYNIPSIYLYQESKVELPQFIHTGVGNIVALDLLTTIQTGTVKYIINDKYYDGTNWVVSDGSYLQANDATTINANLSSFSIAQTTVDVDIVFPDSHTQCSVNNLELEHIHQIYPITNPTIDIDSSIIATVITQPISAWNTFVETIVESGSDLVKYTLSDDNGSTYKYWNGTAWVISSGYSESNTGTEINNNIDTFPKSTLGMKIRIYLHSEDGLSTPSINNLLVNYNDFIYATDNPTIVPVTGITTEEIFAFAVGELVSGSNNIKYVLEIDGVNMYWDDTAWVASSGYAQSNTASEINDNLSGIIIATGIVVKPVSYLHSDSGSENVELSYITYTYDFYNPASTKPNVCIVTGRVLDYQANSFTSVQLKVTAKSSKLPIVNTYFVFKRDISAVIDVDGYFEVELIRSALFSPDMKYDFRFETTNGTEIKTYRDVTIPTQDTVGLNDLI